METSRIVIHETYVLCLNILTIIISEAAAGVAGGAYVA